MANYSKSLERDENRMMNRAFAHSLWGLLLSWVPVLGLILAISGFFRMCVRVTKAHRTKRFFLTAFSAIVLVATIGLHLGAVYHYVRNPDILNQGARVLWQKVTGLETLPWETPAADPDFYNYDYNTDPYAIEGDASLEGNLSDSDMPADFDADFNDGELAGFPEDDDAVNYDEKALFDQMLSDKKSGGSGILAPVG